MKNCIKKVVSILIATAMLFSMMTFSVMAEDVVTVTAIDGSNEAVTLTFDSDLSISEDEAKSYISLTDETFNQVDYDVEISGANLNIVPKTDFINDKDYTVDVSENFGLAEGYSKTFKMETVWETDFSNTEKKPSDYFTLSNYFYNSATGYKGIYSKHVIQDGKLYSQNINGATLWMMDQAVQSVENFTLTFDMANYDKNGFAVFLNVIRASAPTEKQPAIYDTCSVKKFGFRVDPTTNKAFTIRPVQSTPPYYTGVEIADISTPAGSDETVTFNDNGTVTESASVTPDTYKIVKKGLVLELYINDSYVGKYDSTEDAKTVYGSDIPDVKGGIVFAATKFNSTNDDGAFVFGDMKVSKFTLVEIESVAITNINGDSKAVTLTFDKELNISEAEIKASVELLDDELNEVEFSATVSGNNVILTPNGGVEADKVYTVNVAKEFGWPATKMASDFSRMFKIETIWETDFADTSKGVNDFFTKGWTQPSSGGYPEPNAVIKDGKLYIEAVSNSTLWITDEKIKSAENFTLEFDMAHYGADTAGLPWSILFNVERMKGNAPTATSAPNYQYQYHMGFGFRTGTHATNMWGVGGTGLIGYYLNGSTYVGVVSSTCTGKTWTPANKGDSLTFANSDVTPSAVPSTEHFKFVKEGKVISMYKEGELIYTYDTTDEATTSYANANRTNFPSSTAPSAGYIALSQGHYSDKTSDNQGFVYSDMKATRFTLVEIEEIAITSIKGDASSVTLTFDSELNITDETAKTYVKLFDNELNAMDFDVSSSDEKLIVTPENGIESDKVYTINIAKEIGWPETKMASDYSKMFKLETLWETDFADTTKTVDDYFLKSAYSTSSDYTNPAAVIKDGKLYLESVNNATLWIDDKNIISEENFTLEFDMAQYANSTTAYLPWNVLFNVDRQNAFSNTTSMNKDTADIMGFGFRTGARNAANMYSTDTNNIIKYYVTESTYTGGPSGTDNTVKWTPSNQNDSLTFADGGVTPSAVPSTEHFKFVKEGKVISMYKNNELIYTYDSTTDANTAYAASTKEYFNTKSAPSKGYVAIGSGDVNFKKTSGDRGFVFGDMKATNFVVVDSYSGVAGVTGNTAGKGTIKFANFSGEKIDSLKILAVAFKGEKMVGVTVNTLTDSLNATIREVPYEITNLTETPDEIRAFAWHDFETIKPYCEGRKVSVQ